MQTLVGFLLLFAICGLWSLATPKGAAPDELAHVDHAAAAAHGQLLGADISTPTNPSVAVQVPATIGRAPTANCLAQLPDVSADCEPAWPTRSGTVTVSTYVGRYPPLYYVIVGLPSLVSHSGSVIYAMRLVSAALTAVFLAVSFVSASRFRRAWLTVPGVAVAVTPQVIFLGGVVNPSSLEISSAMCLWVCGLGLVTGADPNRRRLIIWATISACVLVQMRGLSPLLTLIIGLTLGTFVGWRRLVACVRRRDLWPGFTALGLCGIFALSWIFAAGSLRTLPGVPVAPGTSAARVLYLSLRRTVLSSAQMVGVFGQLDTLAPHWVYVVWVVFVIALAVAVLRRHDRRSTLVLVGLAVVVLALPTLLTASQAHKVGIIGQARYIMPVSVGAPLLAAYAASRDLRPTRLLRLLVLACGLVIAVAQWASFVQSLHRYRTGVDAPIWVRAAPWEPPLGWITLITAFAVAQILLLTWWWRLLRAQLQTDELEAGLNVDEPDSTTSKVGRSIAAQ